MPSTGAAPCKRDGGVDDVAGDDPLALLGAGAERYHRLAGVDPDPHLQGERGVVPALSSAIASRILSPARTARSASSSCATGAPNTAITASPTNFSTVPP